jgi:hypothetical protein
MLYKNTEKAIQKDFDMVKLIKNQKNLMTLAKCQNFLDASRLEKLNHTKPHIIDLDTEYDEN